MTARTRYFALAGAGAVAAIGILASRVYLRPPPVVVEDSTDAEMIAWCAPGLEAIPGGGCFAPAPPKTPGPAPLLIYLHGRYDRAKPEEELDRQRRVATRASARGFAVLALRGREGQCLDPELASWFCWPASE